MPRTIFKDRRLNKKGRLFKSMWVSYGEEMPPDDNKRYLCWNYELKKPMLVHGFAIHAMISQVIEGNFIREKESNKASAHFTSHWMKVYRP